MAQPQTLQRNIFEKFGTVGFPNLKVDTLSATATAGQHGILMRTTDGLLFPLDCIPPSKSSNVYQCKATTERVQHPKLKDKKLVGTLQIIESWGAIVTITDAMITVYDLHTHEILCQLSETKGCNLFTTQERNCTLVVVNKKKVSYYIWQGTSFDHLTDRSLTDTPKLLHCLSHSLIVGYRRYYESIDIPPITATLLGPNALGSIVSSLAVPVCVGSRILDVEREHTMSCTELPETVQRSGSIILTTGLHGSVLRASSSGLTEGPRETIRWTSAPFSVTAAMPVIVSQLVDSVEIHDCATLKILQRVLFDSPIIGISCIVKKEEREWDEDGEGEGYDEGEGDGEYDLTGHNSSSSSSSNDTNSTKLKNSASSDGTISLESVTHQQHIFVSTVGRSTDALYVLRMTPVLQQIQDLVDVTGTQDTIYHTNLADALNICALTSNKRMLKNINMAVINEKYALSAYRIGDFQDAISHFMLSNTSPVAVISLFPDFVPNPLMTLYSSHIGHAMHQLAVSSARKVAVPRHKITSASRLRINKNTSNSNTSNPFGDEEGDTLNPFGEVEEGNEEYEEDEGSGGRSGSGGEGGNSRANNSNDSDKSLEGRSNSKALGISLCPLREADSGLFSLAAAAMVKFCSHHRVACKHRVDKLDATRSKSSAPVSTVNTTSPTALDAAVIAAELVDTVLLLCLLHCTPPRKSALVDLLSSTNRCHSRSCAEQLALKGPAFVEALLWLYRSKGEHEKVLSALTETSCIAPAGCWTKPQFYTWTADYLNWLWYHDNPTYPPLTLLTLKNVLEHDPVMGMGVLTKRPRGKVKTSLGGRGVDPQEVVRLLERAAVAQSKEKGSVLLPEDRATKRGDMDFPITNGRALALSYLEWLVNCGAAPSHMHDEYAQLLLEGIPSDIEMDGVEASVPCPVPVPVPVSGLVPGPKGGQALDPFTPQNDSLKIFQIYRLKLQSFLLTSTQYQPEHLLKMLPSLFLHERALLLSRLGRHTDVLNIYINQMGDLDLAEEHCSRVYTHATTRILDKKNGVKEIVKGRDRSTDLEDFNSQIGGKKGTSGTGMGMETGGEDGGMTTEGDMSIYLCLLKILLSNVASCRAVPISVQGETKNLSSPSSSSSSSTSSSSSSTSSSSNPSLPLESNGTDTEKEKSNKINKSKNNLNIKNFKLSDAIEVAERCHDKIDTIAFLSLLPKNVPLFQIEKYLRIVLEFGNHKKRNLMIFYQLLRVREVSLRISS